MNIKSFVFNEIHLCSSKTNEANLLFQDQIRREKELKFCLDSVKISTFLFFFYLVLHWKYFNIYWKIFLQGWSGIYISSLFLFIYEKGYGCTNKKGQRPKTTLEYPTYRMFEINKKNILMDKMNLITVVQFLSVLIRMDKRRHNVELKQK